MANPYLILWFDPTLNRLYAGWNQNTPANTPILKQGDNIGVQLHWVRAGTANFPMQEITFPPAADITLAVGRLDTEPTSGTFTVTYGANTTAELDYDITATDLQTALNGLASITAEGGVTVTKNGSIFRIVWDDPSVTANTLSSDVNNLSPTSNSQVVVARAGSATDRQVILFSLKQAPMAACTSFAPTAAPAITVTNIFTNTWRVSVSPSPRTGTFTLTQTVGTTDTTTSPIPFNATALQVQEELDAVLSGYFVIKSGEFSWDITAPSSVVNLAADSALVGYSSMYGVLSMNTAEVEEFLAGADEGTATLEVQADISGEIQTLIQTPVTVINDLISTSIFTLVQLPDVMPVDAVVRYDTPQTPTAGEQLVARTNIAAAAASDIAALQAEDINLQAEIDQVEIDLTSGLAGKADLVHTHTASQISDSTTAGRALLTAADASAQRTSLGLGTMAVETATNYLTTASASSTYLTQANAATTYGLLSNTPSSDQKAALAGQVYTTNVPSATNKYLTASDFTANFQVATVSILTNNGLNHNANNVIATGIVASPDDTQNWLVNVTINYVGATPDLVSDTFWADTNHELYFEEEGNLGGAQMTFKRSSFSFVLPSGVTGYELWSSAHAPFVGASAQLVVSYKLI